MPGFLCDLHIHSCLSPCGDEEMTPYNLVNMAKVMGLDILALTDHNSSLNCPAAARAAEEAGIAFVPGMELKGTVRNVIDFGAFVDIGVHQDGLVHISQITNKYIKHPSEVLKVGDIVTVWVLAVDVKKNRISLTMKKDNVQKPKE